MRRVFACLLCAGLLAVCASADDHHGNDNNNNNNCNNNCNNNNVNNNNNNNNNGGFEGQLVGSAVGEHVAGVASGGAPWMISSSEFNVSSNGQIQVEIRGLLISSGTLVNTVGPVTMVDASLACGDVVVSTTGAVPLNTLGNVSIQDTITVPAPCIAPTLLIRIAATTTGPVANGAFIAVNGLMTGAEGNNDHHDN